MYNKKKNTQYPIVYPSAAIVSNQNISFQHHLQKLKITTNTLRRYTYPYTIKIGMRFRFRFKFKKRKTKHHTLQLECNHYLRYPQWPVLPTLAEVTMALPNLSFPSGSLTLRPRMPGQAHPHSLWSALGQQCV